MAMVDACNGNGCRSIMTTIARYRVDQRGEGGGGGGGEVEFVVVAGTATGVVEAGRDELSSDSPRRSGRQQDRAAVAAVLHRRRGRWWWWRPSGPSTTSRDQSLHVRVLQRHRLPSAVVVRRHIRQQQQQQPRSSPSSLPHQIPRYRSVISVCLPLRSAIHTADRLLEHRVGRGSVCLT